MLVADKPNFATRCPRTLLALTACFPTRIYIVITTFLLNVLIHLTAASTTANLTSVLCATNPNYAVVRFSLAYPVPLLVPLLTNTYCSR